MRSIWVGAGWKMNHLINDAEMYTAMLRRFVLATPPNATIFIIPPFTVLHLVSSMLASLPIIIGAQNMHWEDQGAATGEISPLMVKDCGASLIEIGHSERRASFCETDLTVNAKILAAIRHNLRPLVCVGETNEERHLGIAKEIIARQVKIALHRVPQKQVSEVMFAYEPVWSIGSSGIPADPENANSMHAWIREIIGEMASPSIAEEVLILYGGSVNLSNAINYLNLPHIDGLFIGRAAWHPESFIKIIQNIEQCKKFQHAS